MREWEIVDFYMEMECVKRLKETPKREDRMKIIQRELW